MEIIILVLLRAGEAEHKLKKKMFARTKLNFRKKNTQDGTSGFLLFSSTIPSQN